MKNIFVVVLGLFALILVMAVIIKVFVFDSNDPCNAPNVNVEFCNDTGKILNS